MSLQDTTMVEACSRLRMKGFDGRSLRATGRVEQFNFKCRPDLKERVAAAAEKEGVAVSTWLERVIEASLSDREDQSGDVLEIMPAIMNPGSLSDKVEFRDAYKAYISICKVDRKRPVSLVEFAGTMRQLCDGSGIGISDEGDKVYFLGVVIQGSVRHWHELKTRPEAHAELRVSLCYSSYLEWCKSLGLAPVSLTRFGLIMRNEIGASYSERSSRSCYRGIALKDDPVDGFLARWIESVQGSYVGASILFETWKAYCEENGLEPGSQKSFSQRVQKRIGYDRNNGRPRYCHVEIKPARTSPQLKIVAR